MVPHCGSDLHFSDNEWRSASFMCWLATCMSSLEKCLFSSLAHFWSGCLSFWHWAAWAACVFWRLILCQLFHCYYFLPFWKSGSLFKGQPLFSSSQLSLQQAWWDNVARNPKSEIWKNQRFQEFPQVLTLPLNFWELYIQTEGCVVPENRLCNILGWPSLSMIGMSIVAKLVLSGSLESASPSWLIILGRSGPEIWSSKKVLLNQDDGDESSNRPVRTNPNWTNQLPSGIWTPDKQCVNWQW